MTNFLHSSFTLIILVAIVQDELHHIVAVR